MMEAYIPALQSLVGEGVEFAIIGTWALKVHFPVAMRDYVIRDCDIVLQPTEENLRRAVRVLRGDGWRVTAWEEEVWDDFSGGDLAGKYYLRARFGELTLDATFECQIPWEAMAAGIDWRDGLPLASIKDILDLKRRKAVDAGQVEETEEFIERLLNIGT